MGHKLLSLPGLSGHYADTEDLNLLSADDAHIHQSIGDWQSADFAENTQQSQVLTALIGSQHGESTAQATVPNYFTVTTSAGTSGFVVQPDTEYTFSVAMAHSLGDRLGTALIFWYDIGGGFISSIAAIASRTRSPLTSSDSTMSSRHSLS